MAKAYFFYWSHCGLFLRVTRLTILSRVLRLSIYIKANLDGFVCVLLGEANLAGFVCVLLGDGRQLLSESDLDCVRVARRRSPVAM
jgi:hypothetical protein